jgi:putative transposase
LPSFRAQAFVIAFERRLRLASRSAFRVAHYSIQADQVHLVVEAVDRTALSRGIQGLAIRLARGFNNQLRRRGKVWGDRYHARELRSPREVRGALVYVLMNHKKHDVPRTLVMTNAGPARDAGVIGPLDAFSSAAWFDGWNARASPWFVRLRARLPSENIPVARPRTWLLRRGWRRHGLLDPRDAPRNALSRLTLRAPARSTLRAPARSTLRAPAPGRSVRAQSLGRA